MTIKCMLMFEVNYSATWSVPKLQLLQKDINLGWYCNLESIQPLKLNDTPNNTAT